MRLKKICPVHPQNPVTYLHLPSKIIKKVKRDPKKKQKAKEAENTDSSESAESENLTVSSGDSGSTEDPRIEPTQVLSAKDKNLKKGTSVLVTFKGGKRNQTTFRYVCIIQSEVDINNDLEVMGLKSVDSNKAVFVTVEKDKCHISTDQIVGILEEPQLLTKGERIRYVFPGPVDVFEPL